MWKTLVYVCVVVAMVGCAAQNRYLPPGFEADTLKSSGKDPENCGVVGNDQSRWRINRCVSKNIRSKRNFYAIYHVKGVDSIGAESIAFDGNRVRIFHYDSYIMLREKDEPLYSIQECSSPKLRSLTKEWVMFLLPLECAK